MDKWELHASQLSMFFRCQLQYYYRYVKEMIRPPSIPMILGLGTHLAAEKDLNHKRVHKTLLAREEVDAIARDYCAAKLDAASAVHLLPEEQTAGFEIVRGRTIDLCIDLSRLHHDDVALHLDPFGVEVEWSVLLNDYPFDLAGRIDLLTWEKMPQATGDPIKIVGVRDLKTSARYWTQSDADSSLQGTLYAMATQVNLNLDYYPRFGLDVLTYQHRKRQGPTLSSKIIISRRNKSDIEIFHNRLAYFVDCLERDRYAPADPTSWVCRRRFCGYYDDCKFKSGATG